MCGDNINSCHDMKALHDTDEQIVAYCKNCKIKVEVKPRNKKLYRQIFQRDTLQPSSNLYYKYYGKMNVV